MTIDSLYLLTDEELLKNQIEIMEEIQYGCWPLQDAIRTACQLTLEWTRRQRNLDPSSPKWDAWEAREKIAQDIVTVLRECQSFIDAGAADKSAHSAATAAGLYASAGLRSVVDDMQAAEKRRQKSGGKGRRGTKSKLRLTVEAMFEEISACQTCDVLLEFEAESRGRESVLIGLREQGKVFIEVSKVSGDIIKYDEIGGKSGKEVSPKRIGDILSELRNNKN